MIGNWNSPYEEPRQHRPEPDPIAPTDRPVADRPADPDAEKPDLLENPELFQPEDLLDDSELFGEGAPLSGGRGRSSESNPLFEHDRYAERRASLRDRLIGAAGGSGGLYPGATGVLILLACVAVGFIRLRNVGREIERNEALIVDQAIALEAQRKELALNAERLKARSPETGGESLPRQAYTTGEAYTSGQASSGQPVAAEDDPVSRLGRYESRTLGQRVVYYAKSQRVDRNQRELVESLRDVGFVVQVVQPRNGRRATNALWFGNEVNPVAIEIAAHALIRAGYRLQYIGPLDTPGGSKARVIEIGVSPQSLNRPVITQTTLQHALRRAGLRTTQ